MISLNSEAAQEVLAKIDRDPTAVRYWRQYLVLCFEQKAEEVARTIQVVLNGLEHLWNEERHKAQALAAKNAVSNPKASGALAAAFLVLPLSTAQKDALRRVAQKPLQAQVILELADHYADSFKLFPSAEAHYDRALQLATQDNLRQEILAAKQRLPSKPKQPQSVEKAILTQSQSLGVRTPTKEKVSAASLMRRTGKLTVDQGNLQVVPFPDWPEKQLELEEVMTRLQNRLAELIHSTPRHLRLPRSISPSQWLDFFEDHIRLLLSALQNGGMDTALLLPGPQAPRHQLASRAELILDWLKQIEEAVRQPDAFQLPITTSLPPPRAVPEPVKVPAAPAPIMEQNAQRLQKINLLIQADDLAGAEELLRQKTLEGVSKQQQSEIWANLGVAYQNRRETSRALGAYEYARALFPDQVSAWFNSGMILHEEGSLQPALECYHRASELSPEEPKIWCNLGALQFQLHSFEEAAQSLRRSVDLKPDYARAWDNLASVHCAREEMHEAERCCLRAINFKNDYADPHFKLGAIYFQQEKWVEAEKVLRTTIDLQPGYPLAGYYLSMLLLRQDRLEEALEAAEHATSPPGETYLPAQVWTELGYAFYIKGDYLRSLHTYLKALDYIPERASLWLDSGVAYHRLGQLPQALRHYEQATQLDPGMLRAWQNLGLVRRTMGDEAGAQEADETAQRLEFK